MHLLLFFFAPFFAPFLLPSWIISLLMAKVSRSTIRGVITSWIGRTVYPASQFAGLLFNTWFLLCL